MGLPPLTGLQFAVLDALGAQKRKGRDLRKLLLSNGIEKEGPAFYVMMGRFESSGLVDSSTTDVIIAGKTYREKTYWVTTSGFEAYNLTVEFYRGYNWGDNAAGTGEI